MSTNTYLSIFLVIIIFISIKFRWKRFNLKIFINDVFKVVLVWFQGSNVLQHYLHLWDNLFQYYPYIHYYMLSQIVTKSRCTGSLSTLFTPKNNKIVMQTTQVLFTSEAFLFQSSLVRQNCDITILL